MSETPEEFSDVAAIKLFKAVVLQAFRDACQDPPESLPEEMPDDFRPSAKSDRSPEKQWATKVRSRNNQIQRMEREMSEARTWLLGNSRDFRRICELACWDPEYIRKGAEKLDAAGWRYGASVNFEALAA